MFERFTDRARMVVSKAQVEAKLLGHNYIGTEHLLLGMLAEGEGIAGKALTDLGLTLESVRKAVEQVVGRGGGVPDGQHVPFTMYGKDVMEKGLRQALLLGHSYIGTEHLLLGLLDIKESTKAEKALVHLGIEVGDVRQQVLVRLSLTDLALNVRYPSIPQLKLQLELARAQVTALEQKLSEAEARELLQST
jgi:ATP-dependent Clp protease ATP-binding subunit ClpC